MSCHILGFNQETTANAYRHRTYFDGFFVSTSLNHMPPQTHTPEQDPSEQPKTDAPNSIDLQTSPPSVLSADEADDPLRKVAVPQTDEGPVYFLEDRKLALNMSAIAKRYAEASHVAFSARDKSYYAYDATRGLWAKQTRGEALWGVSAFIQSLSNEVIAAKLLAKRTSSLCRSVLQLVEGCAPMGEPQKGELLAVANGVLDLSQASPSLRPFKKEDWFTSKIPWKYDPDAKCERFINELLMPALGNQDDIDLLQRDFGRQLVAGNKAQTVSVFVGPGGSGKSTLLTILEYMLTVERVGHLRTDKLTTRFETHAFKDKTTLVGKDVPPNFLTNAGAAMIKSLTGSDLLQSEKKYGGKFYMRGDYYVVITANTRLLLNIQGDLEAWRRRIICYYFTQPVSKRVAEFDQTLLAEEGAGILNWLVKGYINHRNELKTHGKIQLTQSQQKRVDQWIDESRGVGAFITKSIHHGEGSLTVDELYHAYLAYAKARGWKTLTKEAFGSEVRIQMQDQFQCERSNHIKRGVSELRGYRGVKFVNPDCADVTGKDAFVTQS